MGYDSPTSVICTVRPGRLPLSAIPFLLSLVLAAAGQDKPPTEYEVKAAFLYNFAVNVEWPAKAFENDKAPFRVAVVGKDPFNGVLDSTFKNKTAQGRPLEVLRFASVADIKPCTILFLPAAGKDDLAKVQEALKGANTLLVCESEGAAARGSPLNFYMDANRVRFEANIAAADRAGVKIGAKLLRIARVVKDEGK